MSLRSVIRRVLIGPEVRPFSPPTRTKVGILSSTVPIAWKRRKATLELTATDARLTGGGFDLSIPFRAITTLQFVNPRTELQSAAIALLRLVDWVDWLDAGKSSYRFAINWEQTGRKERVEVIGYSGTLEVFRVLRQRCPQVVGSGPDL